MHVCINAFYVAIFSHPTNAGDISALYTYMSIIHAQLQNNMLLPQRGDAAGVKRGGVFGGAHKGNEPPQ